MFARLETPLPEATPVVQRPAPGEEKWQCVVWDDPVNLMSYVTYVFVTHFGYGTDQAHQLMLQVHESGSATVSTGSREPIEADVQAMHRYGLWATLRQEGE